MSVWDSIATSKVFMPYRKQKAVLQAFVLLFFRGGLSLSLSAEAGW